MTTNRKKKLVEIFDSFGEIKNYLHKYMMQHDKSSHLSPIKCRILFLLKHHKNIPQKWLVHELHITPSGVNQMIDELKENKYITRRVDKNDKRMTILNLTPKGEIKFKKFKANLQKKMAEIFSTLDDQDIIELEKILAKIKIKFKNSESKGK